MDLVTLIVVPDERSPVRRFRVPRKLLRHGSWVGALALLVGVAGFVDWVKLRLDARELSELRAKSNSDRSELAALAGSLSAVEEKLARLSEFERKVRVIANLPAKLPETSLPVRLGAAERGGGGQGGDDQGDDAPDVSAIGPRARPPAPRPWLGLDDATLRQIREKAASLSARIDARGGAFEELMDKLASVRERLGATPSIWPSDGFVSSGFGWRVSPFTGRRHFHAGVDIAADHGTQVVAAACGHVVFAGTKGPLGQTVVLDHGFGIRTSYGHNSVLYARLGQQVQRGERIAAVGSTGRSTGPHVHYEVKLEGRAVDPSAYVLE